MSTITLPEAPAESLSHAAAQLVGQLVALRRAALDHETRHDDVLRGLPENARDSARNLLHYLALRQHDIRELQDQLSRLGLSRLGRAEAHTLASIDAILDALHALTASARPAGARVRGTAIGAGAKRLASHADALLGKAPPGHTTRIMVTAPTEAAHDDNLHQSLLDAGMGVLRINCAHDTPDEWLTMIERQRRASAQCGRHTVVYADLAGPKLRTGIIGAVGQLAEFKPRRDAWGRVTAPATLWLTPAAATETPPQPVDAVLPVDAALLLDAAPGDIIEVTDARDTVRRLCLDLRDGASWLAQCRQHGYVMSGADMRLLRDGECLASGNVGEVPPLHLPIELRAGDPLRLTRSDAPG